ncbi:hypothetical protein ACFC96_36895 [Streptomyces sp. NPDC055955]|uniref:hypothetical protein n=1 Tax=Streptomyces sp. NPDC055955 TaxID=3345665 RepID=UPI0035DF555A
MVDEMVQVHEAVPVRYADTGHVLPFFAGIRITSRLWLWLWLWLWLSAWLWAFVLERRTVTSGPAHGASVYRWPRGGRCAGARSGRSL